MRWLRRVSVGQRAVRDQPSGGADGVDQAVRTVCLVAEHARADIRAQVAFVEGRAPGGGTLDGRSYSLLWRQAGGQLRPPLLTGGLRPDQNLTEALAVVAANAGKCVRAGDPALLLASIFELLDLITASWELGGVPVDTDAARLATNLIAAAGQIRTAMPDEPPSLPPAIRELMRRNNTTNVYDPAGTTVVAGINLGAEMRTAFLT
jgi:hypothetical protein